MSEVCSVVDTDQFSPGESLDKCGYETVASLKYAGKDAPIGNAQEVIEWAHNEYQNYDGPDVIGNAKGMTMASMQSVLRDAGLHYQVIGSTEMGYHLDHLNVEYIRAWLKHGYPVVISVAEDTVYDLDLDAKPYAWDTTGYYHVILATGIASDGNLLCHDTASIDSNGVRPGPRRYDATQLQNGLTSATAVVMPWLTRPADTFNPLQENNPMPIPQNWKDENGKLIAPNGHYLEHGFRQHILDASSWDATDEPLEQEQPVAQVELHSNRGKGTRQITVDHMLVWTQEMGVKESALGQEVAKCYNVIATLEQQIKNLDTQIASFKASVPPTPTTVASSVAPLQALLANATLLEQEVVQALDVQKVTVQHVIDTLQGK